ncbi:MAG: DUF4168 domain-containing protein [Planctomycetota bacterium]|jgi:hypothetical protein
MKTFILIFSVLVVSIIVILKLITSTGPVTSPEISTLDLNRFDTEEKIYSDNNKELYRQSTGTEITDHKLKAFARAFVNVQSYMNQAGNRTSYEETRKIVQNHGLSVEDYTRIASRMNANSDFQSKVLKIINDVN